MLKIKSMAATVTGMLLGLSSANLAVYNPSQITVSAESNGILLWGDANCDGEVGISDAVLILQAVTNPDKFGDGKQGGLSKRGRLNADVYENGTGITCADALSIQKWEAGIIDKLPESYCSDIATTTGEKTATTTTETTSTVKTDDVIVATTTTTAGTAENGEATTNNDITSQTTTSTKSEAVTVTTTTSYTWTPPKREGLVHDGQMIDEESYKILQQTAKLFNIDEYSIKYSDDLIEYGYTYPGTYWCVENGFSDGYAVQVIPKKDESLFTNVSGNGYEYLAFRPLVEADKRAEVQQNRKVKAEQEEKVIIGHINTIVKPKGISPDTEVYDWELDELNDANPFQFRGWYLIPETHGESKMAINYPNDYNPNVEPGVEGKYWFKSEDLNVEGNPIGKTIFNNFVYTAKQFGFSGFKIEYNTSVDNPVFYSFTSQGLINTIYVNQGAVQIVKPEDLPTLVDLKAKSLEQANGDKALADKIYSEWLSPTNNPCYYWTWTKNVDGINKMSDENVSVFNYSYTDTYDGYIMVPTDEDGNEIRKVCKS